MLIMKLCRQGYQFDLREGSSHKAVAPVMWSLINKNLFQNAPEFKGYKFNFKCEVHYYTLSHCFTVALLVFF